MKKKDVVALVFAVIIFLVTGYVGYTQFFAKKTTSSSSQGVQVEVIGSIPSQFDSTALSQLNDQNQVKDYNLPVDLTGLNNTSPFGN